MKKISNLWKKDEGATRDIVDKLVVHLAQSHAYMEEHGDTGLAFKLKTGKILDNPEEMKHIEWALDRINAWPIYLKVSKKKEVFEKDKKNKKI